MNKRLIITFLGILFSFLSCFAGPSESIIAAIKAGNADQLAEYFDSNVDLKIIDKENIYSKAQAKVLVKDFFSNYSVTNIAINHEGGPETAHFVICNLSTAQGKFRVYFLLKNKDGKFLIQKFRVEKDG